MPSNYVIVLTTLPQGSDWGTFADTLVAERLAACVNVLPEMDSTYSWKGAMQHDRERQVVIKTTDARLEELRARIAALHPYEVPELLVLPVEAGSEQYLAWMRDVTGLGAPPQED